MAPWTVNQGRPGARCAIFVFAATAPDARDAPDPSSGFFRMAVGFEVALGVLALVIGWWIGHAPFGAVRLDDPLFQHAVAVAWGVVGAMPMLAAMWLLDRYPIGPLRDLRRLVDVHLVPLFAPLSVVQMLVVSLAAGVGEELLFRGLLQEGLAHWIGPPLGVAVGLLVASLMFGLCHLMTATYGVLATLVGLYLGLLLLLTDHLLAPITAHAVYDAVALVYLVKYGGRPVLEEAPVET
ncbi:MAG: lysostaphin resistance A-like protein [Pirellulaceae bacterium]